MAVSVIDKIPQQDDMDSGGDDWLLVTAPLRSSLSHKVAVDPSRLYVPPRNSLDRLSLSASEKQSLEAIPTERDTIVSSPLLSPVDTPIVLIGNAGVGKTSWIRFFQHMTEGDEHLKVIYYSQKNESGRPVFSGVSETEKFKRILFRSLVDQLQQICRSISKTGISLFSYSLEQIESGDFESEMDFTAAVQRAIETTYESGFRIILVIDDVDHFDDALQLEAFQIGSWLSVTEGLNVVIPLRTFTYHVLRIDQKYRPRKYYVSAPNLKDYLLNRLRYEWSDIRSASLAHLRKIFSNDAASLNLVSSGIIKENLDGLKSFHEEVIDVISENEHLQTALYSLHNENIDEIGMIISEMICSRFFASTFRGDKIKEIPTLKSKEKIITSYLRGRFGHYRGPTSEYPVADIGVVNPPTLPVSKIILPIHILNFLLNRNNEKDGVEVALASDFFQRLNYSESDVRGAVVYLWRLRLIYSPSAHSSDSWNGEGRATASHAGEYLSFNLLSDFAFRFCEATADVFQKSVAGSDELRRDKTLIGMATNATAIFEVIAQSWANEVSFVTSLSERDAETKSLYVSEVNPESNRIGVDWIKKMSKEVSGRVNSMARVTSDLREKQQFRLLREKKIVPVGQLIEKNLGAYKQMSCTQI